MKTALLQQILSVVAKICEINENEIVSHVKMQDVVDARTIFVYYCNKYGFPAATIAKFIHRSRLQSVHDCLYNYKIYSGQSAAFRYLSQEVGKKIAELFPTT